jgi:hypothetical protein
LSLLLAYPSRECYLIGTLKVMSLTFWSACYTSELEFS